MKPIFALAAFAILLPATSLAATRTYEARNFEGVSVAAGISVDIVIGPARSVIAQTGGNGFDDLRVVVKDNVLRVDRPNRSWFSFGRRDSYRVRVVTPVLRSLVASSGSQVSVSGPVEGDFDVKASSGSEVTVSSVKGSRIAAQTSSGSGISIAGTCAALNANASSGSDLDAEDLRCEQVTVHASSGSDVAVTASRSVSGNASSGSGVKVRGKPALMQVSKSSGASIKLRD